MRLQSKEVGLSDSLMNNSQINENPTDSNKDIVKSKLLIKTVKSTKLFKKEEYIEKLQNEVNNVPDKPIKKKRKILIKNKENLILSNETGNNSICDIYVPKKKAKIKESVTVSKTMNSIDSDKNSTSSVKSKHVSFDPIIVSSHKSNSLDTNLFKTPLTSIVTRTSSSSSRSVSSPTIDTIRKNGILTRKRSLKSPICASSPIITNKCHQKSNSTLDDLFSSEIICSSSRISNPSRKGSFESATESKSSNLSSFKTPPIPGSNKSKSNKSASFAIIKSPTITNNDSNEKKSLELPICTSSPILTNKAHQSSNSSQNDLFPTQEDLFSSQIISSSEDFISSQSSTQSLDSVMSSIKVNQTENQEKTTIKQKSSKKRATRSLKNQMTELEFSASSDTDEIVRTRSGRESRKFSQTRLGKFIQNYFTTNNYYSIFGKF